MNIKNKRITVIGFGQSGRDASLLIESNGGSVFISNDSRPAGSDMALIEKYGWQYETSHTDRALNCDMIVVSPGIEWDLPLIEKALNSDIRVIPEIELAYGFIAKPVTGITGTNGKSTTAYLIYQILTSTGIRPRIGGNISPGKSLSGIALKSPDSYDHVVCELSSFQLEHIDAFRCNTSVLTNISEDHLNRHKTIENYANSKMNIFSNQMPGDRAVVNSDSINIAGITTEADIITVSGKDTEADILLNDKSFTVKSSGEKVSMEAFLLPGKHNRFNLVQAIAAVFGLDIDKETVETIIPSLKGMPHRMEYVDTINSVRIYNNSMCTNPVAFRRSLEIFTEDQTVIVGGRNKDFNIEMIVDSIISFTDNIILIGESTSVMHEMLETRNYHGSIFPADSLQEAVVTAVNNTPEGGVINFSPGFASFDMFSNFRQRGDLFKQYVRELK
ncbi:MAG: UDP-N-acetylmuramoyl-L-alanine--D-glutamate ligase [bacterium]